MITEEQLCGYIDQEVNYSLGGGSNQSDSELISAWSDALNYYFGGPRGDEIDGRSKVISMDMADMIEQTIAQVMPSFDKDDLCEFESNGGEQDDRQAQLESTVINKIVMKDNRGFMAFLSAIKDGFLQRNGIIKCYVDEKVEVDEDVYEQIDEIQIDQLLQDPNLEVTEQNIVQESQETEDPRTGFIQQTPAIYSIKVKKIIRVKQLVVEPVPPEEFAVNSDHNSIFLDNARFICHTRYPTRSELIQSGFDKEIIDELPAHTTKTDIHQRARSRDEDENESDSAQRAGDRVEIRDCYYRVDYDEDGIAERRKIIKAGKHILENEIHPCVPFAAGSPFFLSHRFWHLSFYDKLKQTQDTKTAFLRKTLDNAEGLINQRVMAINGQVNMDDLLSSRPTGVVRVKTPHAVTPYPVQNMGDTGFKMLTYMDKIRKEAGGAQLDVGTSENLPVQGQTAHGMERWMSSQEQLSHLIVKTHAITLIGEIFRISHYLVRRYMPEQLSFNNKGEVSQTVPGSWPPRSVNKIKIEPSMAERQRIYGVLSENLQTQMELYSAGAEDSMVTEANIYNTIIDRLRVAGVNNPEQYWVDPRSQEAQQAAQRKQQSQQAAHQAQIQENDKLLKTQVAIQDMSDRADAYEAELKDAIAQNEQLRKWVETELKYNVDVPGQGQEGKPVKAVS